MITTPVTFLATFPQIQSAIIFGSVGARVQLDMPENELPNAIELLAMRHKILRITVEVAKDMPPQE